MSTTFKKIPDKIRWIKHLKKCLRNYIRNRIKFTNCNKNYCNRVSHRFPLMIKTCLFFEFYITPLPLECYLVDFPCPLQLNDANRTVSCLKCGFTSCNTSYIGRNPTARSRLLASLLNNSKYFQNSNSFLVAQTVF